MQKQEKIRKPLRTLLTVVFGLLALAITLQSALAGGVDTLYKVVCDNPLHLRPFDSGCIYDSFEEAWDKGAKRHYDGRHYVTTKVERCRSE